MLFPVLLKWKTKMGANCPRPDLAKVGESVFTSAARECVAATTAKTRCGLVASGTRLVQPWRSVRLSLLIIGVALRCIRAADAMLLRTITALHIADVKMMFMSISSPASTLQWVQLLEPIISLSALSNLGTAINRLLSRVGRDGKLFQGPEANDNLGDLSQVDYTGPLQTVISISPSIGLAKGLINPRDKHIAIFE